jgi:hypothetical protein
LAKALLLLGRSSPDRLNLLRNVWNLNPRSTLSPGASTANTQIANVMDKLRVISATGGVFVLGASFALGVEEAKKGNVAGAIAYFTGGISQAATAPFAYTQALSRMIGPWYYHTFKNLPYYSPSVPPHFTAEVAANTLYNRAALLAGRVMTFANPIAFLAAIGYAIYSGVEGDKKTEAYFGSFTPTLNSYGLDGDGENDPWYDEPDSTIAS